MFTVISTLENNRPTCEQCDSVAHCCKTPEPCPNLAKPATKLLVSNPAHHNHKLWRIHLEDLLNGGTGAISVSMPYVPDILCAPATCNMNTDATFWDWPTERLSMTAKTVTATVTITIPAPMNKHPAMGEEFWYICPAWGVTIDVWCGNDDDREQFKRGIWTTQQDAYAAALNILPNVQYK